MSYGADFPTADPAGAPLDAPILIGANPVLWGALILLLLAAGLLGWFLRGQSAPKTGDASEAIWKAVNGAAKEAMTADDNALKGKAEHLAKVIRSRLGGVLAIAGGRGGLVAGLSALDKAIAGKHPEKKDEPHKPAHDDHGKGHDDKASDHNHKAEGHGHDHTTGATTTAAAANIVINVAPSAPGKPEKPDHGGHPPHPPAPPKDMTGREQTDALRLAVAAFNEHWRDASARKGELRQALAELSGDSHGPRLSND